MKLKTLILTFLAFIVSGVICFHAAYAGTVVIKGTAKGAEGKLISLKKFSDNLTQKEQLLAKSTIDSNGNFELKCELTSTGLAIIHIEYYMGEMYLEPNNNYTVEVRNLVFNDKLDKVNHYLSPLNCYIKVVSDKKNELNYLISKLNLNYNLFIRKNIVLVKNKEILLKTDTFLMAMQDTFAGINHPFFNDYFTYRIASLKFLTGYSDPYKLMTEYIVSKPILYENIEYMSFMSDYFENYFKDITRSVKLSDLNGPVNKNKSFFEALDVLGNDSLLRNEVLREVVLLKTLDVLYSSANFNKKAVLEVLRQFSLKSKFEKHRLIASNLIESYNKFEKGNPAPEFKLGDTKDSVINLSEYKGKLVYVNFFANWCKPCMDELELMKKLHEKYKNQIAFISISVDREFMKSFYLQRDKKYEWEFLHFNNDYDLLENYSVFSYPSFVLIDKEGKIIQCPAPKPSENIEMTFELLLAPPK
jgi:thiol-disulfide isomerase/thioredoxin